MTLRTPSTETDEKDGKRSVVDVKTGSLASAVNNRTSATFLLKKSLNLTADIDFSICTCHRPNNLSIVCQSFFGADLCIMISLDQTPDCFVCLFVCLFVCSLTAHQHQLGH
jgi:hypothetical protein